MVNELGLRCAHLRKLSVYLSFREAKLRGKFPSFDADKILIAIEFFLQASQLLVGKHRSCPLRSIEIKCLRKHQLLELTTRVCRNHFIIIIIISINILTGPK